MEGYSHGERSGAWPQSRWAVWAEIATVHAAGAREKEVEDGVPGWRRLPLMQTVRGLPELTFCNNKEMDRIPTDIDREV